MFDVDAHLAGLVSWSQDVRAALHRLEPTQCDALRLVYFEQRTQEQVATELRLSPVVVARAVAGGMQALTMVMMSGTAD